MGKQADKMEDFASGLSDLDADDAYIVKRLREAFDTVAEEELPPELAGLVDKLRGGDEGVK